MTNYDSVSALKRIAFRNLARHKVKSILTIAAVMVSVWMYIFVDGWVVGMTLDSKRNIVNYEMGAAKLQTKLYFDKKDDLPMYENFGDWQTYAAALDRAGYDAAPRFTFVGTIDSQAGSAPMQFFAVDPQTDAHVLRYGGELESGRNIQAGAFEVILGSLAAEKIKTGIPQRPTKNELEGEILPLFDESEWDFVRSLYERADKPRGGVWAPKEREGEGFERFFLKRNLPKADLARYWDMLADAGRMSVGITTVIDIKAAPETLRKERYVSDIEPLFTQAERALFERAYAYDGLLDAYQLASDDQTLIDEVLRAMVRIEYLGAIRHVYQLITAEVVGVINAPNPKLNGNVAFIPIDMMQDEMGLMLDGRVTELIIREKGASDTRIPGKSESKETILAALTTELAKEGAALPAELDVNTWEAYSQDFIAAAAGDNWSMRIMVGILFILSFLGIANTMLLAILERTKEIGMMRAQGMTDGQLVFTYMMEAAMVGAFGSALGVLLGCLTTIPMVEYGVDFTAMTESMGGNIGYRVNGIFRSAWNVPVIIGSGIAATLVSSVTAFFPTRKALTMTITDSLRFN